MSKPFLATNHGEHLHPSDGDGASGAASHSTKGDGGGTYGPMERLASLETKTEMLEKRLDRMDDKLDRVLERLGSMPTTNGLWGMIATVIGVSLTMIGIVAAILAL